MAITPLTQWAKIDENTTGDKTIIPAPGATNRIRIVGFFMKATAANATIWKDGTTAMTGAISEAANSGEVLSFNRDSGPLLGINNAFVLNIGSAAQVSGFVSFINEEV